LEGEQFALKCVTKGKPNPQVTWFKDGQQIEEDSNTTCDTEHDEKSQHTASKLQVQHADVEQHDGKMAVEVKNIAGEAVHEVQVTGENPGRDF
jgi:hypothetical protein